MDSKILIIGLIGLLLGASAGYGVSMPQMNSLQEKANTLQTQADLVPNLQQQITDV